MIKKTLFTLFSFLLSVTTASAQETGGDFYQDILISDEVKAQIREDEANTRLQQKGADAQSQARDLLQKKARPLEIDVPKVERRAKKDTPKIPASAPAANAPKAQDLASAPFGLLWGAPVSTVNNMGVILKPIEEKDYRNVFAAEHLPKDAKGFREINLVFGEEDELWRITAIGDFIDDDAAASKILREYRKYYRLLAKKYGNPKEFFTPKINVVEKKVYQNGRNVMVEEKVPAPMGNPDFLAQLQSGEAELYSTFEGNNIGAALAINVDGEGKSYIIIDYKNLKILQSREDETLDIL